MLARVHAVPFRRDVLERAARQLLQGRASSLEAIGNLSTLMGFVGSISEIPLAQLPRLPFPCMAMVLDQPALIHDISKDEVKVVVPEYGRITLPLQQITAGAQALRILTLSPGRDSQRRKLDLSWFSPRSANIAAACWRFWRPLWCCNCSIWPSPW